MLPFFEVQSDCSRNASESFRQEFFKFGDVVPSLLSEPVLWGFWWAGFCVHYCAAAEEEVLLASVDLSFGKLEFDEHLESEE